MNLPIITKHAKKRMKERIGLSKRAQLRHALFVLKKGLYLYRNKEKSTFHMHDRREYIFGLTDRYIPILITVYPKNPKH